MDNWDKAIISHGMSLYYYLLHLFACMSTVSVAVIEHMCLCVWMYLCVCTHVHTHVCRSLCVLVCVCVCVRACVRACMCVCVNIMA